MADKNIKILKKETYLKMIKNSVGSRLFNSLYARFIDSGRVVDVLDNGELSCAFFVSNILCLFQIIDKPHATVSSLMKIFGENSNYRKIDIGQAEAGDIVFYKKIKFENGTEHAHVGFVLNQNEAVSTDCKIKMVNKHPLKNREIEMIYRVL